MNRIILDALNTASAYADIMPAMRILHDTGKIVSPAHRDDIMSECRAMVAEINRNWTDDDTKRFELLQLAKLSQVVGIASVDCQLTDLL